MDTLFARNRHLLCMTVLLILSAGGTALMLLPRAEDPTSTQRYGYVTTRFPGANAERIELLVTEPIEEQLTDIDEIKVLKSASRAGISVSFVELADAVLDADAVWTRLRDVLADAALTLPHGCEAPRFDDAGAANVQAFTLIAAISWQRGRADAGPQQVPAGSLRRLSEDLADAFRRLPGTQHTEIFGDLKEEVLVEVDEATLAHIGLDAAGLAAAISASDAKIPAGQLRGDRGELLVEVAGELDSLRRIEELPIQQGRHGQVVRLDSIANIRRSVSQPIGSLAMVAGRPGMLIAVRMAGEQRIDKWRAGAAETLAAFQRGMPAGWSLEVIFDQHTYVENRLVDLFGNLVLGAVLVFCVVLVMMGWRSSLVVGAALPLSAFLVLGGMLLLGIPIHQMSVTGLIIALGMLIDNAIIMVDEVSIRRVAGDRPLEAVAHTVRALAVPLLSSTLTTVLAFLPIVLLPGSIGEFVGSIAASVILALVGSLFLALTVVPALTVLLDPEGSSQQGGLLRRGVRTPRLRPWYEASLAAMFRRPLLGCALCAVLPLLGFVVAGSLPEQFFPSAERDHFQIQLSLPAQASLAETWRVARAARALVCARPEVRELHWFVGGSLPKFYYNFRGGQDGARNFAQAIVQLESGYASRAVVRELQRELSRALTSAQVLVLELEQGTPFDAPVEVHLYGPELDVLQRLGEEARRNLAGTPGIVLARQSLENGAPSLRLRVDEEEVLRAGLANVLVARSLQQTLEGAFGGSLIDGTFELPLRVRVSDQRRGEFDSIASLELLAASSEGLARIPLDALGSLELVPERSSITRRNRERVCSVQGFVVAGTLPSEALARFQAALTAQRFRLPPGYRLEIGGESRERDEAVAKMLRYGGVLLVLMLATLVLGFRSFRMAGIIALVAAFSVGLGVLPLAAFGYPFGFMSIIGTMGLVGVAVNDSIVVLAGLRADPRARVGEPSAMRRVVVAATRHILTTSVTTMAGFLPLLLDGGAFWPPLAIVIAAGVGLATLLGLYFVPCAYLVLLRWGRQPSPQPAENPAARG